MSYAIGLKNQSNLITQDYALDLTVKNQIFASVSSDKKIGLKLKDNQSKSVCKPTTIKALWPKGMMRDLLRDKIVQGLNKITFEKEEYTGRNVTVITYPRQNTARDFESHRISYDPASNMLDINYSVNSLSGGGSVTFKEKGKLDICGGPGDIKIVDEKGIRRSLRAIGDKKLKAKLEQDSAKSEEACNAYINVPFFGKIRTHRNSFCGPDPSVERVTDF